LRELDRLCAESEEPRLHRQLHRGVWHAQQHHRAGHIGRQARGGVRPRLQTETSPPDRLDFLNSTGAWRHFETGLNSVDLWMGGLAEKHMDFGGMLGSTFSFVFELQLENLQEGDRFYYLSRVQGLNLLN